MSPEIIEDYRDVVKIIKDRRREANITQVELSRNSKVNQQTISSLERGGNVTTTILLKILDGLDLSLYIGRRGQQ